ncbi:MAG: DUF4416 family protein [Halobacteriovoraceae bacterium]|nr:DUF4416 family protein [Halobacteriovoraceae bacterium]
MSELIKAPKCFFSGSILYNSTHLSEVDIVNIWIEENGPGEKHIVEHFPMKKYYSEEMGEEHSLKRIIYCSHILVDREKFADIKLWADRIEKKYSINSKRIVNIDPGLLCLENFQLATGKPYAHRVYLRDGVYSDLTYQFQKKEAVTFPWTYPDYLERDVKNYFLNQREILKKKGPI